LTQKNVVACFGVRFGTKEHAMSEIEKLLSENAVLPLWPQVGRVLQLTRHATYQAARRGEIETVDFGKLKRVPTSWLRRKLGITTESNGAA
jgi:hypothetical protein